MQYHQLLNHYASTSSSLVPVREQDGTKQKDQFENTLSMDNFEERMYAVVQFLNVFR